jgi:type II secretion system protein J
MKRDDRNAGFTLIELVVVIGIFVWVMATAYQILDTTIEADRQVNRNTRSGKIGEGILTRMRRDLQGVVWRSYGPEVFNGIDAGSGDDAHDEIHFLTTSAVPPSEDDEDLVVGAASSVGYVLKSTGNGNYTLFRRVKLDIGESPLDGGEYYEIYNRVRSLEIRYLGREDQWLDDWDASTELGALDNQNWNTFLPYEDHEKALEEAADQEALESGDPTAMTDGATPEEEEEEETEIPLPLPRAVEIVLVIAMGDERGDTVDAEGQLITERVSTIVPIICSEVLRVEDPAEALEDGTGK